MMLDAVGIVGALSFDESDILCGEPRMFGWADGDRVGHSAVGTIARRRLSIVRFGCGLARDDRASAAGRVAPQRVQRDQWTAGLRSRHRSWNGSVPAESTGRTFGTLLDAGHVGDAAQTAAHVPLPGKSGSVPRRNVPMRGDLSGAAAAD
ncbi:conserved hypothetical protein, partial [Trichinella spiralis]|uniref:hypothetical protein n=1 Tax=Trichinella spiralis TaxID=6334 RepID=UPI0001EFE227